MPYGSGPGMPGPYGAAQQPLSLRGVEDAAPASYGVYCHKLYHNLFLMHSLQCCQFSTENPTPLSSDCHLHFASLPRIIEA